MSWGARFLGWLRGRQYQESSFRFARLQDHLSASVNSQPGATLCICGDPDCPHLWSDGGRPQVWENPHGAEAR